MTRNCPGCGKFMRVVEFPDGRRAFCQDQGCPAFGNMYTVVE